MTRSPLPMPRFFSTEVNATTTSYSVSWACWPDQRADMSPPPGSRIASAIQNRSATASTRASSRTAPGAWGCTVMGSPPAAHTLATRAWPTITSARERRALALADQRAGMMTTGRVSGVTREPSLGRVRPRCEPDIGVGSGQWVLDRSGLRMPRNSQSPPWAVESTSSLSVGCAPTSVADRGRPLDDVIAQHPEALHLDVDHIARVDRAGDGRGAGEQHVAGLQGDRPGDVGDEIVHVPSHLVGVAVLLHLAVDQCADLLVPEVPPLDQPWSDGAQRVGALDPQHRAGVGVAEIVQPVVVTDGVSADVVARLSRGDVARGPPDDDGDLALVVQPLAAPRPHDGGPRGRSATTPACGSTSAPEAGGSSSRRPATSSSDGRR